MLQLCKWIYSLMKVIRPGSVSDLPPFVSFVLFYCPHIASNEQLSCPGNLPTMPSMPSRHSLFRFSCPHGGPCWTMVSRFSQDGQVVRYKIGNDGSEIEIGEQYFAHEWFYDLPSLQWRMCLRSPTHNSFRQSLHDLAVHYLDWFEYHVFQVFNRSRQKTWSYSGCIGGRDLGNKTYWICIQAALAVRRHNGLPLLCGVESCTSFERAGDIIECMLGIIWEHDCNTNVSLVSDWMFMRTCVESVALGIEHVWNLRPGVCNPCDIVTEVVTSPDFTVMLPEPTSEGWLLQRERKRLYDDKVDARNRKRLVLQRLCNDKVNVTALIYSFIGGLHS